jgi:hypothetical protein
MSRFTQTSSFEYMGGSVPDPDIVYYNASIVNNYTDSLSVNQQAFLDPPIRFNETRDTPIVRDASKYQFSIVRFVVNGANNDLPLFIPAIQSGTGQTDVNLTEYQVALTWNGTIGGVVVALAPDPTPVIYTPETLNKALAPVPRSMANPNYAGVWNALTQYQLGQIVFYTPTQSYYTGQVQSGLVVPIPIGTLPTNTAFWVRSSPNDGSSQDLSTRYYWVYTYSHWVSLVNQALDTANVALWNAYNATPGSGATYPTYASWIVDYPTPVMLLEPDTDPARFLIRVPSTYLPPSQQQQLATPPAGTPVSQFLFFNVNMNGLFNNFNNYYINGQQVYNPGPGGVPNYLSIPPTWWLNPATTTNYKAGYTNRLEVAIKGQGDNLVQFTSTLLTQTYTGVWVVLNQDYASTSTLWSPIESIVFCSTLLPIQNEATAPPNALGTFNTGNSAATSKSAFQPIITDIALDLSTSGSDYRKMIYYAPAAEYRMADFQNSKQDIRNIDVQVFWRNRLDNNLIPLSMFNLSSVSIKIMFRKKASYARSE